MVQLHYRYHVLRALPPHDQAAEDGHHTRSSHLAKGPIVTTQQLTVSTRPTEGHDIALLRELFTSTRDELEVLSADVRYLLIDMQFRAQRRHFATTYPLARHEILERDGHDVGRLVVDDSGPSVRIIDITVRRGNRGQG